MQQEARTTPLPSWALYVKDLETSRAFYVDQLGFTETDTTLPTTLAEVADFDNDPMLLVGPEAGDVTPYLASTHSIIKPGQVLTFYCQNLEIQRATWTERGLASVQEARTPLDDPALLVLDPDGHSLLFIVPRQRSPEEIIELYAQGPQRLKEALAGLAEQDLELAKAPGEWSLRQLVHHISDGDDLWMRVVKAALTRPGCQYSHDWYTTDNASAELLDYVGRAIEPALLLYNANHEHILQLVRHLPDALECYVMFTWPGQEAQRFAVSNILYSQAVHTAVHCKEIQEIRRLHQR
ncbi:DinB family protein [Ktedonobacter racemifer]|uniref:Glyoxalase/bleomycin resistance protein/dioxygenase n=1 Tax=Ktedonobacter racemifer DSM 44963 TaxID=485913 RepID=D6TVW9_KTERA|nr:DinB family protein [Ktedonobacter racemifer]EFH84352.1 Glyoxalase/bleomycin resistance protein/dioxygenase [Ktedonobacter racemifer DSM 44963]